MTLHDDELAVLLARPETSPMEAQVATGLADLLNRQEADKVNGWMAERRKKNREKANRLLENIKTVQSDIADVHADAKRGIQSHQELMNRRRLLVQALRRLEAEYTALENSEAHISAVEDDPAAYLDNFYDRFHGLADRRPRLLIAVADELERRKRIR